MSHILSLTRLWLLCRYVKVVFTPCVPIQLHLKNIGVISFQHSCFAPHEPSIMSRVVTLCNVFSSSLILKILYEIITSCRMNMISTSMQIYPAGFHFQAYVPFFAFWAYLSSIEWFVLSLLDVRCCLSFRRVDL